MSQSAPDVGSTFIEPVAEVLFQLPGVEAVALGGSRAQGTNGPESDWDIALYYRDKFEPQHVRDIGWPGRLTEPGGWGRVFNGGGKLSVDGQEIDIHYRDLGLIEEIHDDALRGEFVIEPLLFHQAGLPTYILLAELGVNKVLRGELPQWNYPSELRRAAPPVWWGRADPTLSYAAGHARHGRVAQCAGLLSEAACETAHAILSHRGEWVTNEKQLLNMAGLHGIDDIVAEMSSESQSLIDAVTRARALFMAELQPDRFS